MILSDHLGYAIPCEELSVIIINKWQKYLFAVYLLFVAVVKDCKGIHL